MDHDRSTTAESINTHIENSVPYLRFLKGENLIPHLNSRFALLNVTTRRTNQTDDLEDADIWEYFKETVTCDCAACCPEIKKAVDIRDESDYDILPYQQGVHQIQVERDSHQLETHLCRSLKM